MISLRSLGSFKGTESYLRALERLDLRRILEESGQLGVNALAGATPVDSGLASNSWTFEVTGSRMSCTLSWLNIDVENGFPVAIMLQFGYATGTGGYVAGRDYINPAIRPVFDQIEERVWKAVNSAR
jgi:hypothetical protein